MQGGLKASLGLCAKTAQDVHSFGNTVETPLCNRAYIPVKFKRFTFNVFNKEPYKLTTDLSPKNSPQIPRVGVVFENYMSSSEFLATEAFEGDQLSTDP